VVELAVDFWQEARSRRAWTRVRRRSFGGMRSTTMLRRLALILLALALVAGGRLSVSAQAAPQPCAMAMGKGGEDGAMPAAQPDRPVMPCENDTPACAKQGCFLPGVILPVFPPCSAPAFFALVRYSPVDSSHAGRTVEPELFPPIPA